MSELSSPEVSARLALGHQAGGGTALTDARGTSDAAPRCAGDDQRRDEGGQLGVDRVHALAVAGAVDRKSTRLNSSHQCESRLPSSACTTKQPLVTHTEYLPLS